MNSASSLSSKSTTDIIKDARESVAFLDAMLRHSDAFGEAYTFYDKDAHSESMLEGVEHKEDAAFNNDSGNRMENFTESQSSDPSLESYKIEKDIPADFNGEDYNFDSVFNVMLRDLRKDISFLSLRMRDITHTKLCKISSALKACREKCLDKVNSSVEENESLSCPKDTQCYHIMLQITRVAVAVDTIKLLLSHYDEKKVIAALTTSARKFLNRFALESGVEPLLNFPATLTTNNIATVLLDARKSLMTQSTAPDKETESRSAKHPAGDTNVNIQIGSRRDTATTYPSPQSAKRSILHRDGDHLLLNEHVYRYQSRPKARYGLSNFKIQVQSNEMTSNAAMRRQKAMQFSRKQPMVHILNGEIVADDDPRIKSQNQQQQPINRSTSNIKTINYGTVPSSVDETHRAAGEASWVARVIRTLRLNQSVTIPGFYSLRPRQVKIYKIAVTALLVFLLGWKILIFIAIGIILSS